MEIEGETRVGIVPGSVKKLLKAGFEVLVEKGSGESANYLDSEYESAGATIPTRPDVLSCENIV